MSVFEQSISELSNVSFVFEDNSASFSEFSEEFSFSFFFDMVELYIYLRARCGCPFSFLNN